MFDKVTQSTKNITSFGGLNFIFDALFKKEINKHIDNKLPARNVRAKYSYSDLLFSLMGNAMCNGEYVSDIALFAQKYKKQTFNNIPSPDTIEYMCQELKVKNTNYEDVSSKGKEIVNEINDNKRLNDTLVSLISYCKLIDPKDTEITMDYDNAVIFNEKQDACWTYKKEKGYHPGIAVINGYPVHIENRNGNTSAKFRQKEILELCHNRLEKNNIHYKNFRGDSASYQQPVIEFFELKNKTYFIRNRNSIKFDVLCSAPTVEWERVELNYEIVEVASIQYQAFGSEISRRVVVTRSLKKDKQLDLFTGDAYQYRGIITNDNKRSNKEVIQFYNQRAYDSEHTNKCLISDFNFKHLPFPDMDTNTVYMFFMAMSYVLFEYIKKLLVLNKVSGITLRDRVKRVFFRYISICTSFVSHARNKILTVFSDVQYSQLVLLE